MGMQRCKFVVVVVVVIALKYQSFAVQHMVGDDSHWTIPPNNDFYSNWSSSQLFQPGDTLLFEFDEVFYNVMQVSKREYDDCTANQPYQAFKDDGPVTINLREPGIFYYICSVLNYCSLGQKLNVTVQLPKSSPSSPVPETSPARS
ncbi:PREDICTED: mavicyanin-like [Ipomoea nil]|uniref:mavicyanin-like n=1 Tax=Ipomoea nil TaxID=35883 RepID=UPI000900FC39|nr:PREDICTED: mavicyanin-like [Ipomoea nil]